MAKFTFTFREVLWHDVEIEAEDQETAEEQARSAFDSAGDKYLMSTDAELAVIRDHQTGKEINCL